MEALQFLAWTVVHIAIPILAPIALLPFIPVIGKRGGYNAVKNGQLL